MAIRFPTEPMADRVTRRLLALAERQNTNPVQAQGLRIDAALQQPVGEVAPVDDIEQLMVMKTLGI